MTLSTPPRRHRFPVSIISHTVWIYHRYNNSYRNIEEELAFRGISVSHETIRSYPQKLVTAPDQAAARSSLAMTSHPSQKQNLTPVITFGN